MARRKAGAIARRGISAATVKARAAKDAANRKLRAVRDDKENIANLGLGGLAGHAASGYWGERVATAAVDPSVSLTIPKLNMSYGKGGGIALFALGATKMLGGDRTNTVALVTGAALYGADRGIEAYLAKTAELAAGGGG